MIIRDGTVSKLLIFAILASMLGINVKRLMSHKHNEIVNKHRQNSLMTYRSLVNAGSNPESRDIILQQAASAIYQQVETGYVKGKESSSTSITEFLPRTSFPINPGA